VGKTDLLVYWGFSVGKEEQWSPVSYNDLYMFLCVCNVLSPLLFSIEIQTVSTTIYVTDIQELFFSFV